MRFASLLVKYRDFDFVCLLYRNLELVQPSVGPGGVRARLLGSLDLERDIGLNDLA